MAENRSVKRPVIRIHGYEFETTAREAEEFRRFQRRIRYLEVNVKRERFDRERAVLLPSKEDSLDRLYELGNDFADEQEPLEEAVVTRVMADKLHECLHRLAEDERALIFALFFQGKSELEYAAECGVSQQAISKKLKRLLVKLGNMLKSSIL